MYVNTNSILQHTHMSEVEVLFRQYIEILSHGQKCRRKKKMSPPGVAIDNTVQRLIFWYVT